VETPRISPEILRVLESFLERPTGWEGVKNSTARGFGRCNPLGIQVGARHGVPLPGFFHTFWRYGYELSAETKLKKT